MSPLSETASVPPLSAAPPGHVDIPLPGRILCALPQLDDDELAIIAHEMAAQFGFDANDARLTLEMFYRQIAGPDICSHARAAELKRMTIAVCERPRGGGDDDVCPQPSEEGGLGESPEQPVRGGISLRIDDPAFDLLRDFGRRRAGADDPEHQERRARFFAALPGRRVLPVVEAAEDHDFERISTRWWAERDDVPASMMDEDPLIEPEDLRGVRAITAFGLFALAALGAGLWAMAAWVVRR